MGSAADSFVYPVTNRSGHRRLIDAHCKFPFFSSNSSNTARRGTGWQRFIDDYLFKDAGLGAPSKELCARIGAGYPFFLAALNSTTVFLHINQIFKLVFVVYCDIYGKRGGCGSRSGHINRGYRLRLYYHLAKVNCETI